VEIAGELEPGVGDPTLGLGIPLDLGNAASSPAFTPGRTPRRRFTRPPYDVARHAEPAQEGRRLLHRE
jgi:hypothetical protein